MPDTPKESNEHREVLARKGNALKSSRGLQIWGSQGDDLADAPEGDSAGGHGNASMGTAARQAKGGYMAGTEDEQPGRAHEGEKRLEKEGEGEGGADADK